MSDDFLDDVITLGGTVFLLSEVPGGGIKDRWQAPKGWRSLNSAGSAERVLNRAPGAGIALATGDPWVIIDVDPRNGGVESLEQMAAEGMIPPVLWVVQTPSGGWHLWVSAPGLRSGKPLPGIDVQSTGALVLMPPTDGYRLLPRPEWPELGNGSVDGLRSLLTGPEGAENTGASEVVVTDPKAWLRSTLDKLIDELLATKDGGRNHKLNKVAFRLGRLIESGLDRADVEARLTEAALTVGLTPHETAKTIESGIEAGLNEPQHVRKKTPKDVFDVVDDTNQNELVPPPAVPLAVARKVLNDYIVENTSTLMHWRGCWLEWTGSRWVEVEDRQIRSRLYKRLENTSYVDAKGEVRPWAPNRSRISDVIDALAGAAHGAEDIEAPSWLDDTGGAPAREIVAAANTLLHVTSRRQIDLTPRFFNRVSVPFDYDPDAAQPQRWLAFLAELWPDDAESVALLQEWFGYVLSGRTDMHKILLMVGPPRSGKGTIGRILTALVGVGNVAAPTLDALGTNFGMSPLLGKAVAIVPDARMAGNSNKIVERLLSISGEDTLTVDRKYKDPFTGKLTTRFVIISNELPHFGDSSGAIVNRFVVLATTKSFMDQEDLTLETALLKELPGILCWALDGLDRLLTKGHFTVPRAARGAVVTMMDMSSPMSAFLRDCTESTAGARVTVSELYAEWKLWCLDNGNDRPGTIQRFGRDLLSQRPSVKRGHWDVDGVDTRGYIGIRVRRESDLL